MISRIHSPSFPVRENSEVVITVIIYQKLSNNVSCMLVWNKILQQTVFGYGRAGGSEFLPKPTAARSRRLCLRGTAFFWCVSGWLMSDFFLLHNSIHNINILARCHKHHSNVLAFFILRHGSSTIPGIASTNHFLSFSLPSASGYFCRYCGCRSSRSTAASYLEWRPQGYVDGLPTLAQNWTSEGTLTPMFWSDKISTLRCMTLIWVPYQYSKLLFEKKVGRKSLDLMIGSDISKPKAFLRCFPDKVLRP